MPGKLHDMERAKPALLRELSWAEAEAETEAYVRGLSPAERVKMVAELTRAAWEASGRERERFRRVYSYPEETSREVPDRGRLRDGPSRARARDQRRGRPRRHR